VSLSTRNGIGPLTGTPSDPDTPRPTPRGLAGIRKRAALLGGTTSYGPEPDGGRWETVVVLPLEGSR
jgi:signal transduction histidine kinase